MWSRNVNRFELGTFSTKFKWGHAFDGLTVMSVSLLEWRIMGPWLFHYIKLSWTWCDGGSEKQQEWKAWGTPKAKPEAFFSILFANVPLAKKNQMANVDTEGYERDSTCCPIAKHKYREEILGSIRNSPQINKNIHFDCYY